MRANFQLILVLALLATAGSSQLRAHAGITPRDSRASCARQKLALRLAATIRHEKPRRSPLWDDLLLPPLDGRFARLDADWPVVQSWPHSITPRSTYEQRWQAIEDFPLADIIVKPGHNPVRSPESVHAIARSIHEQGYRPALKEADRPSLNIVADAQGRLKAVEAIGGHHRFLAQLENLARSRGTESLGTFRIQDLNHSDLDIYVNGITVDQRKIPGKYPAHALDFGAWRSWTPLPEGAPPPDWVTPPRDPVLQELLESRRIVVRADKGVRSGELLLDSSLTNEAIGSRETLGSAFLALMRKEQPRIAIYRAPGESSRLPTLSQLRAMARENGVQEIVFIPSESEGEGNQLKDYVLDMNHELRKAGVRTRLNLYRGVRYESYIGVFGAKSFRSRMKQVYSTFRELLDLTP